MTRLVAQAPAKVNLTFEIVGRLPDGYHQVSTLLQTIDLEDRLIFDFSPASDTEIVISCRQDKIQADFPLNDSNLIAKAIKLFLSSVNESQRLKALVAVDKQIPIGAGLAGGSSDAAATLIALNYYFGYPLDKEELLLLAGKLGADVPFCLEGGTCVGLSRGDKLEAVQQGIKLSFCLIKPKSLAISTPWVYKAFDDYLANESESNWPVPNLIGCLQGLRSGDLQQVTSCLGNDFEPVVFKQFPELQMLKADLLRLGCWSCHLTGSGPTLYGIVADREMAHMVRRRFFEMLHKSADLPGQANDEFDFWIADSITSGARLIEDYL